MNRAAAGLPPRAPNFNQRSLLEYLNNCHMNRSNPLEGAVNMSCLRACFRRGWIRFEVTQDGLDALTEPTR